MSERVALLDSINPAAGAIFEQANLEVTLFPKSVTNEELARGVQGVQLLGVRSGPKIPASIINAGVKLEAIGCFCVGTSHVDVTAASEHGGAVFNSEYDNTRSVAEHVM